MKQRIVKFAAALLAALCLLALLPVQASAIHMNIRVAVKGKCPPYHFWDGDTAMGLNIDILELMAEKEGLNVEYVSYTTSSDAADALLSGEVDAVLGVLSAAACPEGTRLTNVISSGTISLIALTMWPGRSLSEIRTSSVTPWPLSWAPFPFPSSIS